MKIAFLVAVILLERAGEVEGLWQICAVLFRRNVPLGSLPGSSLGIAGVLSRSRCWGHAL